MPVVCGIKFRGTGKIYYFAPGEVQDLEISDYVIVETARGKEMGQVIMPAHEVPETEIVGELKPIVRRALPGDLLDAQRFRRQEAEALATCKDQVTKLNLPMKVVSAEYNFDGTRLTFCFSSEQRVDFRELVREVARIFKTRIELRQIGVRDEAKMMGGMGKCGRPLCCATWLTEFYPVSIRMAKQQDLPLSPMEISGCCGRLLCCLGYENDGYQEVKGRFPKVGKTVSTPKGVGRVIKVSVLRETVNVLLEDGSTIELTAEQLAGTAPIEAETPVLDEEAEYALDAVVGLVRPESMSAAEAIDEESGISVEEVGPESRRETRGGLAIIPPSRRQQRSGLATRAANTAGEPAPREGTRTRDANAPSPARPPRERTHRPKASASRSDQGSAQQVERPERGNEQGSEGTGSSNRPVRRRNTRGRRRQPPPRSEATQNTDSRKAKE